MAARLGERLIRLYAALWAGVSSGPPRGGEGVRVRRTRATHAIANFRVTPPMISRVISLLSSEVTPDRGTCGEKPHTERPDRSSETCSDHRRLRVSRSPHHPPRYPPRPAGRGLVPSCSFSWLRRLRMSLLEFMLPICFLFRVRMPLVYHPQGDADGRPPEPLPSPPPMG